ncbi:hypothetical protein GOZ97_18895 [Agrobacterium vitis]|uniref:hypothetical protein n=1 Tax=Rhizobium/Agrobacterium group TaxID=227290 RepID=UPI0008DBF237|nr:MULTISPECIES: hypothetical protein [Rhizobium/Agrobacterium group]MCF1436262.1 hypothetical protein [Allorhizobium ampelinum]MCF1448106.1 hypothetical protein [Allorhizobium ampelinum]MUO89061.1 hypothetical protein [Agrobacterium vitis]MUZ53500.1 hypothetical protein [Agrobacterium vitis]MUZ93497.1 hypothetical protein [Agrobacterium vitis]
MAAVFIALEKIGLGESQDGTQCDAGWIDGEHHAAVWLAVQQFMPEQQQDAFDDLSCGAIVQFGKFPEGKLTAGSARTGREDRKDGHGFACEMHHPSLPNTLLKRRASCENAQKTP